MRAVVEPIANETQPTLGQILRERREGRGLSQEEAAQRSRVQLVFVHALEADDYRLLPDGLYLTRFVHEYAGFLGLEPAAAVETFRRQLRRPGAVSPLYKAVPLVAALPWRQVLWTAAVLFPLVPITYILLSLAGKERPQQATPSPPPASEAPAPPPGRRTPEPAPLPPPNPLGSPAFPARFPTESSAPPRSGPGDTAARRHLLEARGRGVTWLVLRVDGAPEIEVWLREGEMRRWVAEREFALTVGSPRSVDIRLDGEVVRLPEGKSGVVREVRLPAPPAPQTRPVSQERTPLSKTERPSSFLQQPIESKGKKLEQSPGAVP